MTNRSSPPAGHSPQQPPKDGYYQQFDEAYFTTDGYEKYLALYEEIAEKQAIGPLLPVIKPEPSWTFLDVGCGMGGAILALRKRGYQCFGTDVSPFALDHAPTKEWMRFGECQHLPFPDNSFDVVMCNNVFQYLKSDEVEPAAKELLRVARRFVTIWVFNQNEPEEWSQELNPDNLRLEDTRALSKQDFIDLFEQSGSTLIDSTNLPSGKGCYTPEWRLTFSVSRAESGK